MKSYTDGVNAASAGGGALVGGMSQITENSAALNQGAYAIFNAILGMVNEQLKRLGWSHMRLMESPFPD